jgi:branched-chain amino acid transport system ATP-binding protein
VLPGADANGAPLLECSGLTVRFGGHLALDDVDVDATAGRVTGLIGPNGAGKTTLFNAVCGLLRPSSGRVHLGGRDITGLAPYRRARLGMARTFQRLELFGLLTVRENVMVAGEVRRDYAKGKQVDEIIERVGLAARTDDRVDELPTGQARLVEIARALATRPRVLLLDEPASGLDDRETDQLGTLLRDLAGDGIAVLLVEHDVQLVMEVCDLIHVLDFGRIIAAGDASSIRTDDAVLAAYLGGSLEAT